MKEKTEKLKPCPTCKAKVGTPHMAGCSVARCPKCGYQAIGCYCATYMFHGKRSWNDDEDESGDPPELTDEQWDEFDQKYPPLLWSGEYPGVAECREYGLLDEHGKVDLNRLYSGACTWNATLGRWVRRQ